MTSTLHLDGHVDVGFDEGSGEHAVRGVISITPNERVFGGSCVGRSRCGRCCYPIPVV